MCEIACKGYCCRRFYLPFGPEALQEMADGTRIHAFNQDEINRVNQMVVYLGKSTKNCNMEEVGIDQHWYTCIYLDKKTGRCGDYAGRPRVCSDYPYGSECQYHKCSTHPWWRRYKLPRWIHHKVFGWTTEKQKEDHKYSKRMTKRAKKFELDTYKKIE